MWNTILVSLKCTRITTITTVIFERSPGFSLGWCCGGVRKIFWGLIGGIPSDHFQSPQLLCNTQTPSHEWTISHVKSRSTQTRQMTSRTLGLNPDSFYNLIKFHGMWSHNVLFPESGNKSQALHTIIQVFLVLSSCIFISINNTGCKCFQPNPNFDNSW